jgi:hypothetical protein
VLGLFSVGKKGAGNIGAYGLEGGLPSGIGGRVTFKGTCDSTVGEVYRVGGATGGGLGGTLRPLVVTRAGRRMNSPKITTKIEFVAAPTRIKISPKARSP